MEEREMLDSALHTGPPVWHTGQLPTTDPQRPPTANVQNPGFSYKQTSWSQQAE